jgi:N utilization substance protein A
MKSDFLIAVTQLAAERGLPREKVITAVEAALVSAYKKDPATLTHNISVHLNPNDGEIKVYLLKTVVDKVTDHRKEVSLTEGHKVNPDANLDDVVEVEVDFPTAGRIAAQTAKQVVLQRLRDAERELVLAEYTGRIGEIIPARIERIEAGQVIVALGRAEGIMPREEQVPIERYRSNQTMQFYLLEVREGSRGAELILSRSHKNLLQRMFEREIPEVANGVVEIKVIAREAGHRSKVAVVARQEGVDPVGSCVGLRGLRIQNIVNELQGEKIDVVEWNQNTSVLITNALSPAQATHVLLNNEMRSATVVVPDTQLSLAIGKEGQNARLAAKLSGFRIDIKGITAYELEQLDGKVITTTAEETEESRESSTEEPVAEVPTSEKDVAVAVAEKPSKEPNEVEPTEPTTPEPAQVAELATESNATIEVTAPAIEERIEDPMPTELLEELGLLETPEPKAETKPEASPIFSVDSEAIWRVPNAGSREPSVLRFAEDIVMPERVRASDGRGNKRGSKSRGGKGRKTGSTSQPQGNLGGTTPP